MVSHVQLFAIPWTLAYQAPLSMGFFRQEYWNGLPFPSPLSILPRSHCLPVSTLSLLFTCLCISGVKCFVEQNVSVPSDQIRSVAQSCLTLCDPMNRSTPGLPVHHQLQEFTQTQVHQEKGIHRHSSASLIN